MAWPAQKGCRWAYFTASSIRRNGVRSIVRAGVPEKVAMLISGHKTRNVFERHNIVAARDLHDAAEKL